MPEFTNNYDLTQWQWTDSPKFRGTPSDPTSYNKDMEKIDAAIATHNHSGVSGDKSNDLGENTVGPLQLQPLSVGEENIIEDSLNENHYQDASIGAAKLKNGIIGTGHLSPEFYDLDVPASALPIGMGANTVAQIFTGAKTLSTDVTMSSANWEQVPGLSFLNLGPINAGDYIFMSGMIRANIVTQLSIGFVLFTGTGPTFSSILHWTYANSADVGVGSASGSAHYIFPQSYADISIGIMSKTTGSTSYQLRGPGPSGLNERYSNSGYMLIRNVPILE